MSLCENPITNPKIFYASDVDVEVLINTFLLNAWNDSWAELDWFTEKL